MGVERGEESGRWEKRLAREKPLWRERRKDDRETGEQQSARSRTNSRRVIPLYYNLFHDSIAIAQQIMLLLIDLAKASSSKIWLPSPYE